jgi:hypothetical protein
MRRILVAGTAALFAAFAVAASAVPASAGGISFGFGGWHDNWHHDWYDDGYGIVVEVPIVDEDDYDGYDWEDHVEWCDDQYQTYDEESDTYAYAVGKRTRCIAPFD